MKTYYLTLQSSVHQATPPQEIMTPVTRQSAQSASIHIASHTTRYDYLNAAKKNLGNDDDKQQQQQSYDQECFDGGDDAGISTRTTRNSTRNSKLKQQQQQQQQQQQIITKKTKTVAFANQNQEPAQEQQPEQNPKSKTLSKRQAKKYDAHIEAVEAANILASIAVAAACASKKERTPTYWTRQHEKAKASGQRQKAMMSVLECDE